MAGSSVIGALRVNLGLDSAAFQRGIATAQGRVEKFAGGLSKRLGALGNLPGVRALQGALAGVGAGLGAALGAGAAAGVAALGALSVSAVNAASEIKNLSAVANATPKEFQGWAAGAKTVGIEQDKLADILKDMNDRVGDFIATGGGPMVDFFERIGPKVGVTADDFRKLSGPQALQLYVSSLEKANVNQQDFTFFMEAIGSDSTALVPLLKNGGKAMQDFAARAESLGAIMSNETVAKLAAVKQSFRDVGTVMIGVRNQVGAAFAPALQALADLFVALMTKGSGVRMVFDGLVATVAAVARFFSSLVTIISGLYGHIWNLGKGAAGVADEFLGLTDAMRFLIANSPIGWIYKLVTGFADLIKSQGSYGAAVSALGDLAQLVWQGIVNSAGAIGPGLAAVWGKVKQEFFLMVRDLQRGWGDFLYAMSAGAAWAGMDGVASGLSLAGDHALAGADQAALSAADAFQEYRTNAAAAAAVVTDAFGPARAKLAELTATTDEAAAALGDGAGGSGDGLAAAADKAGGAAKAAAAKLTPLQEVMKRLQAEAARLKATLWMGETDAAVWDNLTEAGVSAASQSGQTISDLTRQAEGMKKLKAATDDWKGSINSAFSSFITQGGSFKDTLADIIGKLADMVASAGFDALWSGTGLGKSAGGFLGFLGIGKNAEGTRNWRGGLSRVNERGGEIMNLPRGTQIIPNDISKRMADKAGGGGAGGGHVSVGFDASMSAFTAVMQDMMGNQIAAAQPAIVGASVSRVRSIGLKSKSFFNNG